jgi:hypothetical protein
MTTLNKVRKCISCDKRRRMILVDSGGPQAQCTLECKACFDGRKWGAIKRGFQSIGFSIEK